MKNAPAFLILSVAGKRDHPGLAETPALIQQLFTAFEQVFTSHGKSFSLILQSGLADGADMITANSLLQWKHSVKTSVCLAGIIPFPKNEFMETITEKKLFEELYNVCNRIVILDGRYLPGTSEDKLFAQKCRANAYRQQANYLLQGCDVLLAIADEDEKGKAGGTWETTVLALKRGIPVIFLSLRQQAFFWLKSTADGVKLKTSDSSLTSQPPNTLSINVANLYMAPSTHPTKSNKFN